MNELEKKLGCDYQGYEFGGGYEDSTCIDGYLWDLDSCNENGGLSLGGDIPCPKCNHKEWVNYCVDSIENEGFAAYENELKEEDCPFFEGCKIRYPEDWEVFKEHWLIGYRSAKKESIATDPYIHDLEQQIEKLEADLTALRSRLGWHYSPEVPKESGRYPVEYDKSECPKQMVTDDICYFDVSFSVWCTSYPVYRWAYLPEGEIN